MSHLESDVRTKVPSGDLGHKGNRQDISAPNATNGVPFQAAETGMRTDIPGRELHVKVWEQSPTNQLVGEMAEQVNRQPQNHITEDALEDLPTRPLVAEPPTVGKPPRMSSSSAPPAQQRQGTRHGDVDQLDTVPIATPGSIKPNKSARPEAEAVPQHQPWQQQDNSNGRAKVQQQSPASLVQQHTTGPSAQGWDVPSGTSAQKAPTVSNINNSRQTPPPFAAELRATQSKQRKSRKPLGLLLVVLLLLLIGGGIGTWIVLYAPFTVASITQPQQTLTNTQLGVSLQYPSGWTVQVDAKQSMAKLFDSSHTAQFSIVSHLANGGDASHYLQQEASQLTMTALKPQTTQMFAGSSWQELQGNVLINGASYTETLFAVIHQQNMYSIMQLAPQATYAQEEQYVFSSIRSSFQFVA